jgi:hypothetical protein
MKKREHNITISEKSLMEKQKPTTPTTVESVAQLELGYVRSEGLAVDSVWTAALLQNSERDQSQQY